MNESIKIFEFPKDEYRVVRVDDNASRPSLRAHLLQNGFDGNVYHTERVLKGRQTAQYKPLCYRGAVSGIYQTIA